jgi:hypothetical protein
MFLFKKKVKYVIKEFHHKSTVNLNILLSWCKLIKLRDCYNNKLTVSASLWCSIKAENSTSLSLWVAIALPSQGGGGGTLRSPALVETAVDGFPPG